MNDQSKVLMHLILGQLDDAIKVVRGSIANDLLESQKTMSERDFLESHRDLTKNPFNTIKKYSELMGNEYNNFLSDPNTEKLTEQLREKLKTDPDSFFEMIEALENDMSVDELSEALANDSSLEVELEDNEDDDSKKVH